MRLINKEVTTTADFGANFTSSTIPAERAGFGSIQIQWDGTPTGTLYLETTNDLTYDYVELQNVALSGSAGSHIFNIQSLNSAYYQVRFAYTSGTSTAKIRYLFKSADI